MSVLGNKAKIAARAMVCSVVMLVPIARGQTLPAAPLVAPAAAPVQFKKEQLGLGPSGKAIAPGTKTNATRESGTASRDWFGKTLLPLLGVLALAVGVGVALRTAARRQGGLRATLGAGGRAPSGILEVLGRYPVGRGVTLVLLKLDSRILLLSQAAGGRLGAGANFTTLAEITDPEQVASILVRSRDADGDSLAERFKSLLTRFDRQMDPPARAALTGETTTRSDALWDGTRSDIPIIDLTQRPAGRAPTGLLRDRLTTLKAPAVKGARR